MNSVLEAAMDYTKDALRKYATLEDVLTVSSRSYENTARIEFLENQSAMAAAVIKPAEPAISISTSLFDRIYNLEENIEQIKEVLLDLQMTLRTLGLDDMSNKVEDLNKLFL